MNDTLPAICRIVGRKKNSTGSSRKQIVALTARAKFFGPAAFVSTIEHKFHSEKSKRRPNSKTEKEKNLHKTVGMDFNSSTVISVRLRGRCRFYY